MVRTRRAEHLFNQPRLWLHPVPPVKCKYVASRVGKWRGPVVRVGEVVSFCFCFPCESCHHGAMYEGKAKT